MKIIIDAFGGDNAPYEIVKGAIRAVKELKDLQILLTGKFNEIEQILKKENYSGNQIEIIEADDIITNDDTPTVAIRTKKTSSLVVAFDKLKQEEDIVGLISAGSTGAILTGSILKIGRLQGVSRPAMCPILPTVKGGVVCICDCGANVDSKPINLCHFALMASEYIKAMFKIENPRVAILNVGTEEHKGNELVKQTMPLLKTLPINFVGSMEARDALSGEYEVIVCDGFTGNVLLKGIEGAVISVIKMLKHEIKASKKSMFGALFMKKSFKALSEKMDYSTHAGSPFLGCKKIVIKAHGSSESESIYKSVKQVYDLHKLDCYGKIEEKLSQVNIVEGL